MPIALAAASVIAPAVLDGTSALGGGDPLVRVVAESQPIWRRWAILPGLLGPVLFALPFMAAGLWKAARASNRAVPATGLLWLGMLGAAFALQVRFMHPLSGVIALLLPVAIHELLRHASVLLRRTAYAVLIVGGLALAPVLVPSGPLAEPTDESLLRTTFQWLREHVPADDAGAGVIASHDVGHLVTVWGGHPAVATPFSQLPWHIAGNARGAQVLGAHTDEEAFAAARATKARYVVATSFWVILGLSPKENPRTVAAWLLEDAGLTASSREATAHLRMIYESPEQRLPPQRGPAARRTRLRSSPSTTAAPPVLGTTS